MTDAAMRATTFAQLAWVYAMGCIPVLTHLALQGGTARTQAIELDGTLTAFAAGLREVANLARGSRARTLGILVVSCCPVS